MTSSDSQSKDLPSPIEIILQRNAKAHDILNSQSPHHHESSQHALSGASLSPLSPHTSSGAASLSPQSPALLSPVEIILSRRNSACELTEDSPAEAQSLALLNRHNALRKSCSNLFADLSGASEPAIVKRPLKATKSDAKQRIQINSNGSPQFQKTVFNFPEASHTPVPQEAGSSIERPFLNSITLDADFASSLQSSYITLLGQSFVAKFERHATCEEIGSVKTELYVDDDSTLCTLLHYIDHKITHMKEKHSCIVFADNSMTTKIHVWSGFFLSPNFNSAHLYIEPLTSLGSRDLDVANVFILLDLDVKVRRHFRRNSSGANLLTGCTYVVNLCGTVDSHMYN